MRDPREATLLIFTLGAKAESRRRRLLPERWQEMEVDLRNACWEAAVAAGRESGCRIEVSCPHDLDLEADVRLSTQSTGSFGSRLDQAFSDCLERHGGPVVVVGTDVPGLTPAHIRQALDRLAEEPERVVLGPSPDGGFYLLAAARPIEGLASTVSWCCRSTLATLLRSLAAAGRSVVLLEPLRDLDRPADLERWLAAPPDERPGWSALLTPLRLLLAARRRPSLDPGRPRRLGGFCPAMPARGPPTFLPC